MKRFLLLTIILGLVMSACQGRPNLPDPDPDPDITLTVTLSPAAAQLTNSNVLFQVSVAGGSADEVGLWLDDLLLGKLDAPYSYAWDTTTVPEGDYGLQAVATKGAKEFKSNTVQVTVDRSPPEVLARQPEPDSDAGLAATITVSFSEPIDPDSVTTETIVLQDHRGTNIGLSLDLDSNILTIIPDAFQAPTRLQLILSDIRDLAGNALSESWEWNVPAAEISGFSLLSPSSSVTDSSLPERPSAVAADGEGNLVVAWIDADMVYAKRRTAADWTVLGDGLMSDSRVYQPSLALLPDGNPVLAFQDGGGLTSVPGVIRVLRWEDGWIDLGPVNTPGRDAAAPSVATDQAGLVYVSWFEFDGVSSNVYVKRWDGENWQPLGDALDIELSKTAAFPSLDVSPQGTPSVAWYEARARDGDDLSRQLHVKRWTGATWERLGGPLNINEDERADMLSLAVDHQGDPVVVWSEYNQETGSNNIYVKGWTGTTWQQLGGTLDKQLSQRAVYPAIAVDAARRISVAWYESFGEDVIESNNLHLAQWQGSSWRKSEPLDVNPGSSSYYPAISLLGPTQAPVIAWFETSGSAFNLHVKQGQ